MVHSLTLPIIPNSLKDFVSKKTISTEVACTSSIREKSIVNQFKEIMKRANSGQTIKT